MKKILLLTVLIVTSNTFFAQAPQGFNYQTTIRNSAGVVLMNQSVGLKFNILQNSLTGTPVYSETQTVTTDALGQVNCVVGQGTSLIGNFSSINWGTGSYYLEVALDLGSGYVTMGTSTLLSVPYALYANNSGVSSSGFMHYIGELFGGGIVVSVWKINSVEHGLIASMTDLSSGLPWTIPSYQTTLIGNTAQNYREGMSNSNSIISQAGSGTSYAAGLCRAYTAGGNNDWYLPSFNELMLCYDSVPIINEILGDTNGFQLMYYWSSTEYYSTTALTMKFGFGEIYSDVYDPTIIVNKNDHCIVRAVRRF